MIIRIIKILIFVFGLGLSEDVTFEYMIDGMTCKHNCPIALKNQALKIEGVKKCNIDFDRKSASITFDDIKLNQNDIAKVIMKNYNTEFSKDIFLKINSDSCSKSCCSVKKTSSWYDWFFGKQYL